MKIRLRLTLFFIFLVFTPLFFFGVITISNTKETMQVFSQKEMNDIVNLKSDKIETFFNNIKSGVEISQDYFNIKTSLPIMNQFSYDISNSNFLKSKKMLDDQLRTLSKVDKEIVDVMLVNTSGNVVYSSNTNHFLKDLNKPVLGFNKDDLSKCKVGYCLSDIFINELMNNQFSIMAGAPISDFNGKFIGLVVFEIDMNQVYDILDHTNDLGKSAETIIAKKVGDNVLYLSPLLYEPNAILKKETLIGSNMALPIQQAVSGKNGSGISIDYRGIQVMAAWKYLPSLDWGMVVKIDTVELFNPIRILEYTLIIFGFIILIFTILMGILIANIITSPIEKLNKVAKKISKMDFSYEPYSYSDNDELGNLSETFHNMALKLKELYVNLDKKVEEQTKELISKEKKLEDQKEAMINVMEDINKEKIFSQQLAGDLKKFQLAVENVSDQIVITDIEGIVIYVNKATKIITGYNIDDILGKKAGILWHIPMSEEYYKNLWKTIKDDKKTFTSQIQNRRKSGQVYDALISISPILDDNNNILFFVGLERDITVEKDIDRSKTEFVSLAAHQLKTPIGAVSWYLEMILDKDYGEISEKQRKILLDVYDMTQRMIKLVGNLLNVSRIELGKFIVQPVMTNYSNVCDEVLGEFKEMIISKKHMLIKNYQKNMPEFLADHNVLTIIFQNLISNAIEFTPDNGKISISIKEQDNMILISVADNGITIPISDQSNIFGKLFRASNAQIMDTTGSGLGLYMLKKVVESAGGQISFKSTEGEDTVFLVTFPISGMSKGKI